MSVRDRDLGLKRIIAQARRFPRRLKVGVLDPEIAIYGTFHEMQTRWMRSTFDGRQTEVDDQLRALHADLVTGGDVGDAQREIAEGYADAYRAALDDLGLVESGALRDSIEVTE